MNEVTVITERQAFFTTATLAKYLSLSERHVRELVRTGTIPSYKFGASRRIDPQDVDSWLQAQREDAA